MGKKNKGRMFDEEGFRDRGIREHDKRASRQRTRIMLEDLAHCDDPEEIEKAWLEDELEKIDDEFDQ